MSSRIAAFLVLLAVLANTGCRSPELAAPNPPVMTPLTDRHSPAYTATKLFMHGVNLGNYLEVPPGENWAVTCDAREFAKMRAEGFDHVRVPVGWHHYTGPAPDYKISPAIFASADFVVTNALAAGLSVIINIHHFNEFTSNPPAYTDQFLAIWRQVAAHYQKFPGQLAFELLNEPKDAATTAVMNPVDARAIAEIRKTNPHRTLFVGPGHWNSIEELQNLVLPPDDNVIVTVHCYSPAMFTHQGASWMGPDYATTNIFFPGPPARPVAISSGSKPWVVAWLNDYNTLPADKNPCGPAAFAAKLKFARDWSDHYGRPVHLGEFGVNSRVDLASRARYLAAFRQELDAQRIGWCLWDWSAAFRYWDKQNNRPLPGLHEALFGPPPVRPFPPAGIPRRLL
jgi:endoglucanase